MNTKNTGSKAEGKSDVALREEVMQKFWEEHDIFNKSVQKEAPNGEYIFYDGPPFATGLPHYGHILASTIKDAIPRFWTMQGYRVPRKWGWDCHGLPLENLIEKRLGLATKRDIEEYGVQNFNEAARDAVLEYADDWGEIIPRMGRWADMENDYKTMDSTYTESVWWVFSELYKKGLVYEGFKSMHLCPRCGTTLSNFEVNQGYKDIKDISVYVELPLVDEENTSLIVWTTTPWTLPGNMAAAVNEEFVYAVVEKKDEGVGELVRFIVAKDRVKAVFGDDGYEIVKEIKGSELVGKSYLPPFEYYKDQDLEGKENAWKIYHADYVEIGEEGTGAVHIAPAYGDDDMKLAQAHGVPIVHHVDTEGHFMEHITDFAGQLVKPKDDDEAGVTHLDADIEMVKTLKVNNRLFKKENITHSYPHCWRCDTPLLNYATTSWFVEVTKIKDQLVAENSKVQWVPAHVGTNRFGKWLEGARDWAVSRQRYWGAPLPIWRNPEANDIKVFGSIAELTEFVPRSGNTYTIMRHGEAQSNIAHAISTDIEAEDPLTENGVAQVQEAAKALADKNIDLIISSPFGRTSYTATMVRDALGLTEEQMIYDDRIQEIQLAEALQGKHWDEYNSNFANWYERFTKVLPDSENRRDLQKRAGAFLYEIEQQYQGKNILIVSHAGVLLGLESAAAGFTYDQVEADHAQRGYLKNAEIRDLPFVAMPHNDNYELDFHRPYIDDIELFEGGTKLERVPDVFDCWFESGSMPYASQSFPRSQPALASDRVGTVPLRTASSDPDCAPADLIEKSLAGHPPNFPANFIAEGLDQTRGWFYSLIVLGTALFGKSPFENVIVNGLVLAENGKKMSKKLQNYPDPMELADRVGVDAMRFYLLSAPIVRGEDLNFSEKEVLELQRKNIGRLHNVLAMYETYADGSVASRSDSIQVLDRWILARLNQLIAESTAGYKNYELDRATRPVTDFIDDLSVWYLRRSRDRLKSDDQADKEAALGTLRHVLQQLALVMAPAMPFYAEYLWSKVKADTAEESVHLAAWPQGGDVDVDLLEAMTAARVVVTKALDARVAANIKVRQPIAALTGPELSTDLQQVVLDEVNAKAYTVGGEEAMVTIDTTITPELQVEGDSRDFIRAVQSLRKEAGMQPQDRIMLTVEATDAGKAIVTTYQDDIKNITGTDEIVFAQTSGHEVTAGEHSFVVSLAQVN